MRLSTAVVAALLSGAAALAHTQSATTDPKAILAATRTALGGDARLSAVKTFVMSGRTRQVRGDNLVPIEFEISVELPNKYLRKDEIPAQESGPTATGFNGDELLQDPPPPPMPERPGVPAPSPAQLDAARRARVQGVKQDFVRLTLGMFAASFESFPLDFTYVGQAEAPQGKAHVLEAKGAGGFTVRYFINSTTNLPLMVSWQGPAGRGMPGGRGGPGGPAGPGAGAPTPGAAAQTPAPPAGAPAAAAPVPGTQAPAPGAGTPPSPPKPVEQRIYYADYRETDGLTLPFRIRRATGADTTEETVIDRYRINTKIDPRKFEVRK